MNNQREFKFRAWNKEMKEMLKVKQLWFERKSELPSGVMDQYQNFHEMEDIVLMQYTGEKNKEGKEIYEGDILRFNHRNKKVVGYVYYELGYYFVKNEFYISENEIFSILTHRNPEIVGNIYENPDLLKHGERQ